MIRRLAKASAVPLALLLASCGQGQSGAPVGSTIVINPVSVTVAPTDTNTCGWFLPPVAVHITVLNSAGQPLNDVGVSVEVPGGLVQMYDDANNNGVLDSNEQTPVSSPYVTTTGPFGTKIIFVSPYVGGKGCYPGGTGLAYSTTFSAYSGVASAQLTISATTL